MPIIKTHAGILSKAKGLNFGPSIHLQPYFVYVNRVGSGKSAHMCRYARAFADHRCDKSHALGHLMHYLMKSHALGHKSVCLISPLRKTSCLR